MIRWIRQWFLKRRMMRYYSRDPWRELAKKIPKAENITPRVTPE